MVKTKRTQYCMWCGVHEITTEMKCVQSVEMQNVQKIITNWRMNYDWWIRSTHFRQFPNTQKYIQLAPINTTMSSLKHPDQNQLIVSNGQLKKSSQEAEKDKKKKRKRRDTKENGSKSSSDLINDEPTQRGNPSIRHVKRRIVICTSLITQAHAIQCQNISSVSFHICVFFLAICASCFVLSFIWSFCFVWIFTWKWTLTMWIIALVSNNRRMKQEARSCAHRIRINKKREREKKT